MEWQDMTDEQIHAWIRKNKADDLRDLLPEYDNDERDTLNAIMNDMNQNPMYTEGYVFKL